jgi:putative chitinase
MPFATDKNVALFVEPLTGTMELYKINTPQRMSCFIAQIAHESGSLRYVKELASGSAYDTGKLAVDLGNTPEDDGDGEKYKGRGLIQITGNFNYKMLSRDLGVDFINFPQLLEEPLYASTSAGWFWNRGNLNELADKMDFKAITRRINGGLNGYEDRLKYLELAKKVFSI